MNIAKDYVVSLEVEIWDLFGNQLEASAEPLSYLHGGYDEIFPAVEAALEGKGPGDALEVELEPEDAFGDYDDELVRLAPREAFPDTLEVGMQFEGVPGKTTMTMASIPSPRSPKARWCSTAIIPCRASRSSSGARWSVYDLRPTRRSSAASPMILTRPRCGCFTDDEGVTHHA